MTKPKSPEDVKLKRRFLPENLRIDSYYSVEPFFKDLLNRKILTRAEALQWLDDRSELAFVLEEDLAWRYIRMNCHTDREDYTASFQFFVKEIEPRISRWSDKLDKKWLALPFSEDKQPPEIMVVNRQVRNRSALFREENVSLQAEMQVLEQVYGKVASEMSVTVKGKELTLQQAANYLRSPDRNIREQVFGKIVNRRLEDKDKLSENLDQLVQLRTRIARNAGFDNYRDFRHRELARFDYSFRDCFDFHESVRVAVVPLANKINEIRKGKLGLETLRPFDLDCDPDGRPSLKPFHEIPELTGKAIKAFGNIDPMFGDLLRYMNDHGFLDLESRKNKAPGGFNYPLYEANIPFIYMNATGNLRDLETMFHEGGHAVHSFLSSHLRWIENKELPAEIAELASMSMELISMDQWGLWFSDPADHHRAKREQLEGIVRILPWIAAVDKFQHQIYTHPEMDAEERNQVWIETMKDFGSGVVSWEGFEDYRNHYWQTQLHIFEVPFYYIEYGIAQLGALALWRKYKYDPDDALRRYKKALSLGYSRPIPEVYAAAGISFDFSREYLVDLMGFVGEELDKLNDR